MALETTLSDRQGVCASEVFIQALASQVNQHDVDAILQAQRLMLLRFEKTNEMLINCNALANARCQTACQEFKRHTHQLLEMKKDLDSVYRRIRNLKAKLTAQYPAAFTACGKVFNTVEEEAEPTTEKDKETETSTSATEKKLEKDSSKAQPQSSSCSQTTTPSPLTSSSSDTG